jgi:uncharacterized protein with PIN domain
MKCMQCAAVSFSAAARTMVDQSHRCAQCGGELALVPVELPVAVAAGEAAAVGGAHERRFERD